MINWYMPLMNRDRVASIFIIEKADHHDRLLLTETEEFPQIELTVILGDSHHNSPRQPGNGYTPGHR